MRRYLQHPVESGHARAARSRGLPGPTRRSGFPLPGCGAFLLLALLLLPVARAASLQDRFADRELITANSGNINGSNVGAGVEPGEPRHGGKPGGHSVWISWLAPADGVATFRTEGSDIDTLLSAYYFGQPADTTIDKLKEAARNDDAAGIEPASLIQFGALAGRRYEIAIDGFGGATGDLRLRWDFIAATSPPPVIVSLPSDQAARQGDPVTLSVDLQTSHDLKLQWRFNGESFGAEGPVLVIPSLQPANLGRYTLRIDLGDVRFETDPVELQINSEGQTNALARDKLLDAPGSGLTPDDDHGGDGRVALMSGGPTGVSRGYNGTQIFNTTYATPDPTEPRHCGLKGGASYWYSYQPPADGLLVLDTIGSSYDTFIAVYTYTPPLTGYGDLVPVGCDNDGAQTNGAARLSFPAAKGKSFLVVVDGLNGARGVARLNYQLDTNGLPTAPHLVTPVAPVVAVEGTEARLAPQVGGSPPMTFVWRRGTIPFDGATNAVLVLPQVGAAEAGDYILAVDNGVPPALEVTVSLRVILVPRLEVVGFPPDPIAFRFLGVAGQRYGIERASLPGAPWETVTNGLPGEGKPILFIPSGQAPTDFFRIRTE